MPCALGSLRARITGLKEWDREVAIVHNTVDDDTPAPGTLPGQELEVPRDHNHQEPSTAAERTRRSESWEGDDPGP